MNSEPTKNAASVTTSQRSDEIFFSAVSRTEDDETLIRLGKKPVLKRTFAFLSSVGFTCTLLCTWEGVNLILTAGLTNGGTAGLIYGYIITWLGTISVFSCLAELVSMAPISSGQYHWVSMLAPPNYRRYLSYMTGWITTTAWLATSASGAFLGGTLIQTLIELCNPSYEPKSWHGTLLCWALVAFSVFVNVSYSKALPMFEGFILFFHIAGFFAILIPLVVLGPHSTASDVFTTFFNGGDWPTQGLSFFVGLLGNVFAFLGADGAVHMSEEIRNATTVVPQSMMTAVFLNGTIGFAMTLGLVFCLGNLDNAIDPSSLYPFLEIYHRAVQSVAGAAAMGSFILIMLSCALTAFLASSSRVLWSFSRDRGVPGWTFWSKLDKRTKIPVFAVMFTTVVCCLLSLINIGSATAFNDLVGLSVSAFYTSYIPALFLLLWRRCRGEIVPANKATSTDSLLTWGPWRIRGFLGILNNIIACAFLILIWFFAFWPPATPVVASTMNYNSLMLGIVLLFSTIYYFVWAKKIYTGPIIEVS